MQVRLFLASFILGASTLISSQNIRAQELPKQEEPPPQALNIEAELKNNRITPPESIEDFSFIEELFKNAKSIEKPTDLADRYEYIQAWQEIRLQILNQPGISPKEITTSLNELIDFYYSVQLTSIYAGDPTRGKEREQVRDKIIADAKPKFQKLFIKILDHVSSGTPETKVEAVESLNTLFDLLSRHSQRSDGYLDVKNNAAFFFDKTLSEVHNDEKSIETIANTALALLALITDDKTFHEKYINWLNMQIKSVLKAQEENKLPKLKMLGEKTREYITYPNKYTKEIDPKQLIESLNSLMVSYNKMIIENSSDVDLLSNSLHIISGLRYFYSSLPEEDTNNKKLLLENMETLFSLVVDEINNPNSRNFLMPRVCETIKYFNFNTTKTMNIDFLINILTDKYFKQNHGDIEGMSIFLSYFYYTTNNTNDLYKSNIITLQKIISKNEDYFLFNINKLLDEGSNSSLMQLSKLYMILNSLPDLGINPDPPANTTQEAPKDPLREELRNWTQSKVLPLISNYFLVRLENTHVKITVETGRRNIENRNWVLLNKEMQVLISCNPPLATKWQEAIEKSLSDENPYDRGMAYEALSVLLDKNLPGENETLVLNTLRKGLLVETAPQVSKSIGNALSVVITAEREAEIISCEIPRYNPPNFNTTNAPKQNEPSKYSYMLYDLFFKRIGECINSQTELEDLAKLRSENLTPGQMFIVDLVRIRRGDYDLFQELMPDKTIQGRISREDYLAVQKLQHNAFIALANSAIFYDDEESYIDRHGLMIAPTLDPTFPLPKLSDNYKETVFETLLKELDSYLMYSDEHKWGEEVAQILELNSKRNLKETGEDPYKRIKYNPITKEDKDKVIEDIYERLFGKYGSIIEIYKDRLVIAYCQENKISYVSLSDKKKEEIKNSREIKEKIETIRQEFAIQVMDRMPNNSTSSYYEYLNKLGFDSSSVEKWWKEYLGFEG